MTDLTAAYNQRFIENQKLQRNVLLKMTNECQEMQNKVTSYEKIIRAVESNMRSGTRTQPQLIKRAVNAKGMLAKTQGRLKLLQNSVNIIKCEMEVYEFASHETPVTVDEYHQNSDALRIAIATTSNAALMLAKQLQAIVNKQVHAEETSIVAIEEQLRALLLKREQLQHAQQVLVARAALSNLGQVNEQGDIVNEQGERISNVSSQAPVTDDEIMCDA